MPSANPILGGPGIAARVVEFTGLTKLPDSDDGVPSFTGRWPCPLAFLTLPFTAVLPIPAALIVRLVWRSLSDPRIPLFMAAIFALCAFVALWACLGSLAYTLLCFHTRHTVNRIMRSAHTRPNGAMAVFRINDIDCYEASTGLPDAHLRIPAHSPAGALLRTDISTAQNNQLLRSFAGDREHVDA